MKITKFKLYLYSSINSHRDKMTKLMIIKVIGHTISALSAIINLKCRNYTPYKIFTVMLTDCLSQEPE